MACTLPQSRMFYALFHLIVVRLCTVRVFCTLFERYRVLFVNCIGLGYGSFLSYAANDLQVASANEGGEGVSIGDTDVLVSEHPR